MITARNYAAQLEKETNLNRVLYLDEVIKPHVSNLIKTSQHFALPDDGIILNDNYKGLYGNPMFLPFDCITVEYFTPFDMNIEESVKNYTRFSVNKRVILGVQNQDEILLVPFSHLEKEKVWIASKVSIKLKKGALYGDTTAYIYSYPKNLDEPHLDMFKKHADQAVKPLLELIEALTCKNVYFESLEVIDEKKNERRIKAGKLPLYETKILVVDSKPKEIDTTWKGGTHASPRQHLRRGHIRRLPSGNIWINNMVIGKAKTGKIDKSYAVK